MWKTQKWSTHGAEDGLDSAKALAPESVVPAGQPEAGQANLKQQEEGCTMGPLESCY